MEYITTSYVDDKKWKYDDEISYVEKEISYVDDEISYVELYRRTLSAVIYDRRLKVAGTQEAWPIGTFG